MAVAYLRAFESDRLHLSALEEKWMRESLTSDIGKFWSSSTRTVLQKVHSSSPSTKPLKVDMTGYIESGSPYSLFLGNNNHGKHCDRNMAQH